MVGSCRLVFCLVVGVTSGMASPPVVSFAPLARWLTAVENGDAGSLRAIYSAADAYQPQQQVQGEIAYWAGLKAAGATRVSAKVLSEKTEANRTTLVLRIYVHKDSQTFVAEAAQLWQLKANVWGLVAWKRGDLGLDAGRTLTEPAQTNPELYPPPADASRDVQRAAKRAKAEGKRVLVVFGANWCYDCHVLDATFRSAAFAPLVTRNYVVVHVNTGDQGRDNEDLAKQYGINLEKGTPQMAVLDPDERVVAAQHGEFTATARIGPSDVRTFLERWKAGSAR